MRIPRLIYTTQTLGHNIATIHSFMIIPIITSCTTYFPLLSLFFGSCTLFVYSLFISCACLSWFHSLMPLLKKAEVPPLLFNGTLSDIPNMFFFCVNLQYKSIIFLRLYLSKFVYWSSWQHSERRRQLSLWLQWICGIASPMPRMLSDIDLQRMLPLKDLFKNNMCVYLSVGIWT